jgi:O-antigen/teichoic acid export membrane protein
MDAPPASTAEPSLAPTVDPTRVAPGVTSLRRHTARGTLINSGFQIGLSGLGALKRIAVAAFLTRAEFGLWGILLAVLLTLVWLKDFGIADKYIQQSEPDQEAAFQKAFTMELILSAGFWVFAAAALPLFALAYGQESIIVPGLVLALAVPLSAFEAPAWIPYRRMQYARQRWLTCIDPILSAVATIGLAAAGLGYWGLVLGALAGTLAGGIVCTLTSPYRLRLRGDRATLREYASFSWPLVGSGLTSLIIVQGSFLVASRKVGLAGIGAIGLAATISSFASRADGIVSQTIYPAICAVAHRADLLAETFVKSNRIALMWSLPFAGGVALFASDLVHFILGERWRPAVPLLVAISLTVGFTQIAFNWAMFMRATNRTRPIFTLSVLELASFAVITLPAILIFGLAGYAGGGAVVAVIQLIARGVVLRPIFHGYRIGRQLVRSMIPPLPAAGIVLLSRLIPGDRTLLRALAELAAYSVAVVLLTGLIERPLVRELVGYLRRQAAPAPVGSAEPRPSGA